MAIDVFAKEALFQRRPELMFFLLLATFTLVWTVLPDLLTTTLPRDTLEALYWGLGRSWTTPKHPPLAPFLAETTVAVLGRHMLPVYALGALATSAALAAVAWLGRELYSIRVGIGMALLSAAVLLLYPLSYEFNPNIALLPFWALVFVFGWRGFRDDRLVDWVALGAVAGLGGLAKYQISLPLIALASAALATRSGRSRLLRPGPWLAAAVFFAVLTPHLLAARAQGFITFELAGRDLIWEPERSLSLLTLRQTGAFIAAQLGESLGVILLVFLLIRGAGDRPLFRRDWRGDRERFLLCVTVVPILITVISGIGGTHVRAPWGLPLALMTGPLAVALVPALGRALEASDPAPAVKTGWVALVVLQIVGFTGYFLAAPFLSPNNPLREHVDGPKVAKLVESYWARHARTPLWLIMGIGNGARERQVIGSVSLFAKTRPAAFQSFWVLPPEKLGDEQIEQLVLERYWTWIDPVRIAREGAVVAMVGEEPIRWRRVGLCLTDFERFDLPLASKRYRPQTLWLGRIAPGEPWEGSCAPGPLQWGLPRSAGLSGKTHFLFDRSPAASPS